MFFVFCFSTVLGLINLQLWEWFFSLPFRILIYCLVVWSKYRVFQYGLANWLPWSSALTPKRNGSQTDMDRWQMYALGLGSTCHCHEQQWCCSPSGICSSKVASRWPTSENLVRELGDGWPCGISQEGTKELMLKKDAVIQRPWLSRITVLSCSLWAECALEIDFASLQNICLRHKEHGQRSFVLL